MQAICNYKYFKTLFHFDLFVNIIKKKRNEPQIITKTVSDGLYRCLSTSTQYSALIIPKHFSAL